MQSWLIIRLSVWLIQELDEVADGNLREYLASRRFFFAYKALHFELLLEFASSLAHMLRGALEL